MTVDVNTAFDAERASQIGSITEYNASIGERYADQKARFEARVASGSLRDLGNGRFESTQGWDAGEVWYLREGMPQALPESNLDMSKGSAALYSTQPEWHGLGTVIPGGTSDVQEVLAAGGLDFDVVSYPTQFAFNGKLQTVPGSFVNVRTDTGAPLGVVGKIYTPFQNVQAFDFLSELTGKFGLIYQSAGATYGGSHVFVSVKLPQDLVVDEGGIADPIQQHLVVMNTHDGSGKFKALVTPWRPRCGNTERFAVRDAQTSWGVRHTANGLSKIEEARRNLGLTVKYFDAFAAEETSLARIDIELDQFADLIADLYPQAEGEESKRGTTIRTAREGKLEELFAKESRQVGRTAYAAERAVTDYLDHVAPRRELSKGDGLAAARATAILEGSSDDLKTKAHQKLMLLVRS
jgi:phage/plasmid-like protein (TIGR03299 family)